MSIEDLHPLYSRRSSEWVVMRDTHEGESQVKSKGPSYLPHTPGQKLDGMAPGQDGWESYEAYRLRARFPDIVRPAVEAMIGVMHNKPPVIELPDSMEPLRERCTLEGESLISLLSRMNQDQLVTGRIGLLLDVRDGSPVGSVPYISTYSAESIMNWDSSPDFEAADHIHNGLSMVVLNESGLVRTGDFEWGEVTRYRLLLRDEKGYSTGLADQSATSFADFDLIQPSIGGRRLRSIPFVVVNTTDITNNPVVPPLLGLAELALTIYRADADYRQSLFMQGQDTLVVTGVADTEAEFRTGAGANIVLPTGGTAEFIGVDSAGLSEMRTSLENDKSEAAQKGGQLLDTVSRQKESGEALNIRVTARTATLNQIAETGAFGLQTILRAAASWMGANPEEVVVKPNLDFVDNVLEGKTLVEYMTARSLGAPYSLRSIHAKMAEKDLTELTYEEELAELEKEEVMRADIEDDEDE